MFSALVEKWSCVPAVSSESPLLVSLGVELGLTERLHQSWKYVGPDPPSPTRIHRGFYAVRHNHGPLLALNPRGTLQRRQLTFLLLAFSGTSVTLLVGFGMSSKAGSFCLHTGTREFHPLRCVFASGCWPPRCRVLFLWRGQTVDGPSVLCKQEIKSSASVEYGQIPVQQAPSHWHC